MSQYNLVESDIRSIPQQILSKHVEIDWTKIEQMVGSRISPTVRSKYEQIYSGLQFKILSFLTLFSRIGNVAHIWFVYKYIFSSGLSDLSFAIWSGLVSVQCITYLYRWWFIDRYNLNDIDRETGEEIVYENDTKTNINVSQAKQKISHLWNSVMSSNSKWKWIVLVLLIMIAALLCKYIRHAVIEGRYQRQLKNIKRLLEQDANINKSNMSKLPNPDKLANMNLIDAQKIAQNFVSTNNINSGKKFSSAIKIAVSEDINRNKVIANQFKKDNPQQYEKVARQAKITNGKSFFDSVSSKYKEQLSVKSLLTNLAVTSILCMSSGPIGILTNILTFSIPSILVSGIGGLGSGIFTVALFAKMFSNPAGFIGKAAGGTTTLLTYIGIGLICACAIRWLFNFLLNPKKNSKKSLIDKSNLNKELGGNIALKAANDAKNKQRSQNTSESYIYSNRLYLNEGVLSVIKEKVVNFLKETYRCLRAVASHPGFSKVFKIVLSLLAVGFILVTAYFGITAIA